jgi:hypothetical protein
MMKDADQARACVSTALSVQVNTKTALPVHSWATIDAGTNPASPNDLEGLRGAHPFT